jgi:Trk K+ transport system NAD-binding subunit
MTTAIMGVGKIGTVVARNLVQGGERVVLANRANGHRLTAIGPALAHRVYPPPPKRLRDSGARPHPHPARSDGWGRCCSQLLIPQDS